jgi:glycosyltransferase involved in cell wall biosynthesis
MAAIKKKIAVVNIFYPPKALGGATRIVADEVSTIVKNYGDDYEVVVFTADTDSTNVGKVNVYGYDGYRVYAISTPLTHETNWNSTNQKIALVFAEFLAFEMPDLVHFHCIQALTGSVLEVTQKLNIPNVVTIHDAWWISDHQFLVDESGNIYPDGHPDLFLKSELRTGTTLEQSLLRKQYLKGLLRQSDAVLAVSETFTQIYKNNGVPNITTNENGISNDINWGKKNTSYSKRVVCAHIGGMADHKGYKFFKQAVMELVQKNIEVLVVDHQQPHDYVMKTCWGQTSVKIIGRVEHENINTLYSKIDVIFAPSMCVESFGLVTREAVACCCWIVASNLGAIGENVSPRNGIKVSPSKDNLLSALREIDEAPEKFKGYASSGAIRYSSDQVNELVEVFNKILNKKLNLSESQHYAE